MGILSIFGGSKGASGPIEVPSGTFTVDRDGHILSSTLPHVFPQECIHQFTKPILAAFRSAKKAEVQLNELVINYSALRITAKELQGGALVFLAPHGPKKPPHSS